MTSHRRYVAVFFLPLALAVIGAYALVASGFYYRHSTYFWDTAEEHQYSVAGVDADVLLVGDSSLLHGIVPPVVRAATGVSVYNLGVPAPALVAASAPLVDNYLRANRRPRLIVLYLSLWTRAHPPYVLQPAWYEAITMLIRHGTAGELGAFFAAEPNAFNELIPVVWLHLLSSDAASVDPALIRGTMDGDAGYVPPLDQMAIGAHRGGDCGFLADRPVDPDIRFLEAFRQRYRALGIPVALYLAPVSDCTPRIPAAVPPQVYDNEPYAVPDAWFLDNGRLHMTRAGAEANSRLFAAFLGRYLQQQGSRAAAAARLAQE